MSGQRSQEPQVKMFERKKDSQTKKKNKMEFQLDEKYWEEKRKDQNDIVKGAIQGRKKEKLKVKAEKIKTDRQMGNVVKAPVGNPKQLDTVWQKPINEHIKKQEKGQERRGGLHCLPDSVSMVSKIDQSIYDPEKIKIKMVLAGEKDSGKTNLILSYTQNKFNPQYDKTVMEIKTAQIRKGPLMVYADIHDTPGSQQYMRLRHSAYYKAHMILICFSLVDVEHFENLDGLYNQIKVGCPTSIILFVGTKQDLRGEYKYLKKPLVQMAEIEAKINKFGEKLVCCSALTQTNLTKVFDTGVDMCVQKKKARVPPKKAVECQLI